jgi:chromosome segregation ATPase
MSDEVTLRVHAQMKRVSDKFDALDTKLDDLESKRGQLRQVIVP